MRPQFTKTVHPIAFSSLSGHEFERLVFATLLRMRAWHSLNWHGQSGGDGGRDIIGVCDDAYGRPSTVVVACANWKAFTASKAIADIDSLVKTLGAAPDEAIVVAGSSVSSDTKDKIDAHARSVGIRTSQTWSAPELEENLRFHAPSVLKRFFEGVELPDEESMLRSFALDVEPIDAAEAARTLERVFRRPAFETSLHQESSLPAFRQAIGDTIGALNTGMWRDREGAIIARVPSIASISNAESSAAFKSCVDALTGLRTAFDDGLRSGQIRPCGCGKADCPIFFIDERAREQIERRRDSVIRHAQRGIAALGPTSKDSEA